MWCASPPYFPQAYPDKLDGFSHISLCVYEINGLVADPSSDPNASPAAGQTAGRYISWYSATPTCLRRGKGPGWAKDGFICLSMSEAYIGADSGLKVYASVSILHIPFVVSTARAS